MVSCRFPSWYGTFTMLLVERSSETGVFRHLSDHVFGVRNFGNTKSLRVIFFSKYFKFNLDSENAPRNWEKLVCFWDNCIWIGTIKLSLVRAGYFSSVANVLKSSPKIWHVKNRDFFQLNWLGSDQWIWRRCCEADLNSAWARLPCCLSKGRLKGDFLDIYLTTFSESVISEMQNLWGSSFDEKYLKFLVDCNNAPRNSQKVFCFRDNYIWNGSVKLSLLRTG